MRVDYLAYLILILIIKLDKVDLVNHEYNQLQPNGYTRLIVIPVRLYLRLDVLNIINNITEMQ